MCCLRLLPLPLTAAAPYCNSPAEEVPAEGHTDSRFSVKCRWYRSVVTKGGQVNVLPVAVCDSTYM